MQLTFKKFGPAILTLVGGGTILGTIWWVNGAERDDFWLYLTSFFLVCYSAWMLIPRRLARQGER